MLVIQESKLNNGGDLMESELSTLGVLLAAIIVPISTIAMLKVHNANK
jgi:hypothetical protein